LVVLEILITESPFSTENQIVLEFLFLVFVK